MSPNVVVVGAGPSGLAAGEILSGVGQVTLVDRLPATGGTAGWDDATMLELTRRCERRGVRFALGTTALRFDRGRLLLAGPGSIRWLPADWLVVASGVRPATRAELGIAGSRAAGVLPVTVAIHLLRAGARIATRAAIVGATPWADEVSGLLHEAGATTVPVAGRPLSVQGHDRVESLEVEVGGSPETIACDAVILAGPPRPLRNIDGALDVTPRVTFAQCESLLLDDRLRNARTVAESCASLLRGGQ